MIRFAGKTAGEPVACMMAAFRRLAPAMRDSVAFDNDAAFAQHTLLRGTLAQTTYIREAYASWRISFSGGRSISGAG